MVKQPAAVVQLPGGRALDGRYRLEEQIGTGGLGVVYRATHEKLAKPVAVKLLHAHFGADPVTRTRFEREAKALAALEHPNIVLVTDYGVERDTPYLVMELLAGQTLAQRLEQGALSANDAYELALPLLQALAYVHGCGLVHRDIKPSNVFLQRLKDGGERLKLLDFGLAKFMLETPEADPGVTRSGAVLGTPAYMSPEQASGEAATQRSDVYAAGVLLLEMLAGRTPFAGDAIEQLRGHLLFDVPELGQLNPTRRAHPELDAFFRRALAKRPSERFADAKEMLAQLEALPRPWFTVVSAESVAATGGNVQSELGEAKTEVSLETAPADRPPRAARPRKRRLWLLAGLLLGVCVVGYLRRAQLSGPESLAHAVTTKAAKVSEGVRDVAAYARVEGEAVLAAAEEAGRDPAPSQNAAGAQADAADDQNDESAALDTDNAERTQAASKPRVPARNPWRRPVPKELRGIRAALLKGARGSDSSIASLHRYNREHPADVRGFLLLGHLYSNRDWSSDAVTQYQIAYQIDASSRGAPEILPSLINMIARGFATNRASRFVEMAYRADALPAIARALRTHRDDARAQARLNALRTRLTSK